MEKEISIKDPIFWKSVFENPKEKEKKNVLYVLIFSDNDGSSQVEFFNKLKEANKRFKYVKKLKKTNASLYEIPGFRSKEFSGLVLSSGGFSKNTGDGEIRFIDRYEN